MTPEPRFYANEFPEPNELVVVKVARIENNMGAYVTLLEYGRMEGLILPSELSKRRFRSISKLIRVGRQEVVMVVRVDTEKGYVDLSKKRVAPEDIAATEEKYSKSKKVYLTARQVAGQLDMDIMDLNKVAIWPLYSKYGHAYDGLKEAVDDSAKAFEGIDCPDNIIQALVADMKSRLQPECVRIRARIHVSCSGEQGVVAVRNALLEGQKTFQPSPAECNKLELKVQLIASPLYVVIAQGFDKQTGIKKVMAALEAIKNHITSAAGGEYHQQGEIMVFGLDEDAEKGEHEESGEDSEEDDEDEDDDSDNDSNAEDSGSEAEEENGKNAANF
eukprot:Gregarina_sp_Poly_1__5212@NODE_2762_length_1748_cov_129_553837_g392_i3_p1_GENE_NODE_2762_length_1748_cov_129_553837_g392_i3NODE_2762_length_1748_cov_129_553837_g392_i3_p1_ORF_typecomplete_len332_score60_09EIF_2_alpha/PF07541_12/9_6e28EIF_2_alpha/PF07541_12/3_1e02S1/PF00575_23/2_9e10RNA_pol_3_Rpc31/PF11705_8/0_00058Astro_capsid_p/PF12226_8/0_092BUD22/PF09073_10/0_12CENPB_dimeris/PF09026_10/0_22GEN1_C/PF18380_1/0_4NOA36/PF06524_12/0_32Sigma70_ner/PF04546_13/87Sigma70_ner/PF04546_13/1_4DNA_pol_phi/